MEHSGEVWQELDFNGERLRGVVPAELEVDKVRLFYGAAVMLYRFNDDEVEEVKWIKVSKLDSFWPNLKWTLQDDKLFRINLEDFAERIAKKYENN